MNDMMRLNPSVAEASLLRVFHLMEPAYLYFLRDAHNHAQAMRNRMPRPGIQAPLANNDWRHHASSFESVARGICRP
jgi:hypothetical protein